MKLNHAPPVQVSAQSAADSRTGNHRQNALLRGDAGCRKETILVFSSNATIPDSSSPSMCKSWG